MKVTGYKDSNGDLNWCVHTPRGLAPFADAKDCAIEVAGGSVHYAMSFGHMPEHCFANYRKVASFTVEERSNAK